MHVTEEPRLTADYRAVLVPLDGSKNAERALGPGEWLAKQYGAELHLVVAAVPSDDWFQYGEYLREIVRETATAFPHRTGDTDVADVIRARARSLDPCLVCMATHGRSRAAAVGSVFARLARTGEEPLVAIGPSAALPTSDDPRRTVICVGGGSFSERLVDRAAMWARALRQRLEFVTVADDAHRDAAENYVRNLAADPDIDDVPSEFRVLEGTGRPHAVLARYLAEHPASFVAAATHSRKGAARALIGSETARIIRYSPIPVLTLPQSLDANRPDG
jgi:nucleotide-binding universal stress UspA family protein